MYRSSRAVIRTPDQRLRIFLSSTLQELADERAAAARAVRHLHLAPVMFELGARPHAPRSLYRAYLDQSDVFVGIYWQRYGWVAPGEDVSGLEDEYRLATHKPKLIYVKTPASEREPRLKELLARIRDDDHASYKTFSTLAQLRALLENDLALLLSERFAQTADPPAEDEPRDVSSLPSSTSSFVGRETELSELRRLLRGREARLVTLSGPGGVGKTRLALQVGRTVGSAYPGGTFFVSLASTTDPALVLPNIAQQIGVREHAGQEQPLDRLAHYLRGPRTLLVLDNFEQIVHAAPEIAQLLAACPNVTLLVTSRAALRVRGEHEVSVRPFDVSLADGATPAGNAVKLFLDRARAINPNFAHDRAELAAVAAVCRRLDGLPLAIELAAARAKVLSAQAILERLDHSLQLLTSGPRDLPARQRTLRGTLDWSYDLLEDAERRLFARLSVFDGGWTLDGAQAVCQCEGVDVLDTLMSLVDHSLIQIQLSPGQEQRFSMLVTVREYARERLAASADEPVVARAHAEYILGLALEAAAKLRGSDQPRWRGRLAAELDNIRAALRWSLDADDLQIAARLQMALAIFWWVQGYAAEARRWADELLAHDASLDTLSLGQVHLTSGLAAAWEGDYVRAAPLLGRAIAEFRQLSDHQGAGVAQMALAYALPDSDNYEHAEALLLESAADLYQAGDLWAVNIALQSRAEVVLVRGDAQRARELYQDSLELAKMQADTRGRAQALVGLGFIDLRAGNVASAADRLRQSVALSMELSNPELLAYALRGLAGVGYARHELARAAQLLGSAQALADTTGTVDWPVRRRLYAGFEQDVRAGLGAAKYAEAYAHGRKLSVLSEAAEFALAVDLVDVPVRRAA